MSTSVPHSPHPRLGRRLRPVLAALLACGLLLAGAALGGADAGAAPGAKGKAKGGRALPQGRPSFLLIQTDDQTLDQLYASIAPAGTPIYAMPNTLSLIAERGITFTRYYVPYPLCCPSRVSLLTGRYAHNNNVRGNNNPQGGSIGFARRGAWSNNLATWLQAAGYRTVHVGKWLNGYGDPPYDDGSYVPPGWSAWHSVLNADTHHYFYGYKLNNNGTIEGPYGDSGSWETREYGQRDDFGCPDAPLNGLPCLHLTDVLTRVAAEEMLGTPPDKPFYVQLDYTAPHGDFRRPAGPEPTPRNYDLFAGAPLPRKRSEGLNEGNVNDKPRFIREAPYVSPQELRTYRVYYQKALESLRDIDEGVKRLLDTLGAMGRLRNTYVIFLSDNGFFFGEHRLTGGKFLAYEPSTHVPLLMRGPGIKPGSVSGELAANIDIAPTILELAGAKATKSIDGRSLVPYMRDPQLRSRRAILFESFVEETDVQPNAEQLRGRASAAGAAAARRGGGRGGGATASIVAPPKDYVGIRYGPYKYIEWPSGEKELYDITKDPNELNNRVRDRNLAPIRNFLHRHLRRLAACVGRECSKVLPKLPLTKRRQARLKRQKERERREKERARKKKPPRRTPR